MATPIIAAFMLLQATASISPAQATTAATASASAPAPDAQPADTAPADPVVCRRIDQAGSPFSEKQCHRLSVWNRMAREGN